MSDDHDIAPPAEAQRPADEPPRGTRAMAVFRWLLVVAMAVIALAALEHRYGWLGGGEGAASAVIYYCPMHPGVQQDHPGDCPICGMTLVPRTRAAPTAAPAPAPAPGAVATGPGAYWCPMHPEVTSDDPEARCPKCGGMKLVPRPPAAPSGAAGVPGLVAVTLTPERVQLIGMRTALVTREPLAAELRTVGMVTTTETGLAVVQTRFAGWIEAVRVAETGQRVAKGQVLATVYSPELLAAQQEHLNALRWAGPGDAGGAPALTAGLAADSRTRLELLGIGPAEIAQLERDGQPLRAIPVRAPVSGTITARSALEGLYVQPGTALFQVADLSRVWVVADIHEHELGRVKLGQKVSIDLAAYPGEAFTGKVAFIYPALNETTRTLRVRVDLRNPGQRLKPGMYGNVTIQLARAEALVVPTEALIDTGALQYVYIAKSGGTYEPRRVITGARAGGKVELVTGVAAGESVVSTATFLLDSESHLQATLHGETPASAAEVAP